MNLLTSKGIGIGMPETKQSLEKIFKLRHYCYRDAEAIIPNLDEKMQDQFDPKETTINFFARNKKQIVGAIRGCIYDPTQKQSTLPAFKVYRDEIHNEMGYDHSIYESCRFVVHPETDSKLRVHFALVKTAILTAWSLNLDYIITACRQRHMEFYTRMGMRPISDAKIYPGLKVPMILLASEISNEKRVLLSNTYKSLAFDRTDLFTYRNKLLNTRPELANYLTIQSPNHVRA